MKPLLLIATCGFDRAKTRLRPKLGDARTRALASVLFDRALHAASSCRDLAEVLVISDAAEVRDAAEREGFAAAADNPSFAGHAAQLRHAANERRAGGAVAVLMADLPLADGATLRGALEALSTHEMVLAPDRHRAGVNFGAWSHYEDALMHFGNADSFHRHLEAARSNARSVAVLHRPALAWDLDEPRDIVDLLADESARNLPESMLMLLGDKGA